MGTYIIRPTILSTNSFDFQSTVPGLGDLYDCNAAGSYQCGFQYSGACIYLDGSPTPIAFATLPAGFTLTDATFRMNNPGGWGAGVALGNTVLFYPSSNFFTPTIPTVLTDTEWEIPYSTVPSMLNLMLNGNGLSVISVPFGGGGNVGQGWYTGEDPLPASAYDYPDFPLINGPFLYGTYTIQGLAIANNNPVSAGSPVTITSPNPSQYNLLDNEELFIDDIPVPIHNITAQSSTSLTFDIPYTIGSFSGTATLFWGTVAIGTLDIRYENVTGIYRLVKNKTTDTLYRRNPSIPPTRNEMQAMEYRLEETEIYGIVNINSSPNVTMLENSAYKLELDEPSDDSDSFELVYNQQLNTTVDVKIPNPYAATAFIGG